MAASHAHRLYLPADTAIHRMPGHVKLVAALYDVPLRYRPAGLRPDPHPARLGPLSVSIEDPALCPRFTAGLADVTVGPSPDWLAGRLTACGVRSINNIVDITNYVLLETGHPILPMAVHGTHEAIRKGDWRFGVTDAEVRVLEPISVEGLTLDDVDALRDRTRDLIAATVTDMGG